MHTLSLALPIGTGAEYNITGHQVCRIETDRMTHVVAGEIHTVRVRCVYNTKYIKFNVLTRYMSRKLLRFLISRSTRRGNNKSFRSPSRFGAVRFEYKNYWHNVYTLKVVPDGFDSYGFNEFVENKIHFPAYLCVS